MTLCAVVGERCVIARNRTGVEKLLAAVRLKKNDSSNSADDGEEADPVTGAAPEVLLPVITQIAFVALGDLFLRSTRRGHGRRSIVKESYERMPTREHEQQKRKGHMHKQPGVQPVVQSGLQIEHPAFVAPLLNFFYPAAIGLAHAQFCVAKSV